VSNNPDKQRSKIARVFERHFRHFGFKKTTVDDVAAELGVSKKTIYNHFRSKEEIFTYIISKKARARKKMVEREIMDIGSAEEKLETMIRINFREFRKKHRNKSFGIENRHQTGLASNIFRKTFFKLLKDIIEEGIENKEFDSCEPSMTVRYVQSLISESLLCVLEDPDGPYEEYLVCTVKKLLKKTQ
jgi:AcrR family transcriptional regulator